MAAEKHEFPLPLSINTGTSILTPTINVQNENNLYTIRYRWMIQGQGELARYVSYPYNNEYLGSDEIIAIDIAINYMNPAKPNIGLYAFYSRLAIDSKAYELATPQERTAIKGLGYSSLCYILRLIIHNNIISPQHIIYLTASPNTFKKYNDIDVPQPTKDYLLDLIQKTYKLDAESTVEILNDILANLSAMTALVNFYILLGFETNDNTKSVAEHMILDKGGGSVSMHATLSKVIERCDTIR